MKTKLYKDRTSVYCWLFDASLKLHVCLKCVKMLYNSDNDEISKSINITMIPIFYQNPACLNFTYEVHQVFSKCTIKSTSEG